MGHSIRKDYDGAQDKWLVVLNGEIDISNADWLNEELAAAYGERMADMDVDVSEVPYIDSRGLGIIISLYGTMKENGKKLTILNPQKNVKKLLKIMQFDKVLCKGGGNGR